MWINLLCCFDMKNNFYIDSMDLLHFEKENIYIYIYICHGFIALSEKNYQFL